MKTGSQLIHNYYISEKKLLAWFLSHIIVKKSQMSGQSPIRECQISSPSALFKLKI